MTPIFEIELTPKAHNSSIKYILVRIDDPVNVKTKNDCLDFMERQFPFYNVQNVLEGYKQ